MTGEALSEDMIAAVVADDVGRIAALLEAGAGVSARNERGETAFSYACANNSIAAAPNSGNSGMSQIWSRKFIRSPLEQIHFVGQHGFLVSE